MGEQAEQTHYHGHRQRLRARFLRDSGASMADYELVELLLTQAVPRGDVKPLAKRLIAAFDDLAGVVTAPPEKLKKVKGVGEAVIAALKLTESAAVRMLRQKAFAADDLSSLDKVTDYCRAAMGHQPIEQFRGLFLDVKNRLIADELLQQGSISQTPIFPREVLKRALDLNAASLILVHNHPSGDPTPSQADVTVTKDIQHAATILDLAIHDHIVVARNRVISFRMEGLL